MERCGKQKDGFDSYCIRPKGHTDNRHLFKPWSWWHNKGLK